jgi:hypothetical protein
MHLGWITSGFGAITDSSENDLKLSRKVKRHIDLVLSAAAVLLPEKNLPAKLDGA